MYIIGNKDELEKNQKSDSRTFKKLLGRNGISALRFSLIDTQTFLYVSEDMVDITVDVDMAGLVIEEDEWGTDTTEATLLSQVELSGILVQPYSAQPVSRPRDRTRE